MLHANIQEVTLRKKKSYFFFEGKMIEDKKETLKKQLWM